VLFRGSIREPTVGAAFEGQLGKSLALIPKKGTKARRGNCGELARGAIQGAKKKGWCAKWVFVLVGKWGGTRTSKDGASGDGCRGRWSFRKGSGKKNLSSISFGGEAKRSARVEEQGWLSLRRDGAALAEGGLKGGGILLERRHTPRYYSRRGNEKQIRELPKVTSRGRLDGEECERSGKRLSAIWNKIKETFRAKTTISEKGEKGNPVGQNDGGGGKNTHKRGVKRER